MSKAVVCTGADPTIDSDDEPVGEWQGDEEVADVTVADGVTEIAAVAFHRCKGLTNLSFLKGSGITTVGDGAFRWSGVTTLQGIERVRKIGMQAFALCEDLRTIEGLGCEEMGVACFTWCTLLQSMKGWPASMTVIPERCFLQCTGLTTVDCDLSRVTSIGSNAFRGCTSLLPPSLSKLDADPAAVLAFLKRKSKDERMAARYAIYASVLVARKQEGRRVAERRRADPLAARIALLPKEMAREIVEFAHGVVVQG
ncbi:hypothetical protein TeGR_g3757 [Tetraparma gracilis]|uniref:Leucine-rich repeat domain-containing protein n=1 Tax=Tetraparma gracilis TaxID=2962635 RepID=A0ABQ6MUA9_9STRA|nr:hypothetical protein TeGR_g3757 [Tetraparma gracilis]